MKDFEFKFTNVLGETLEYKTEAEDMAEAFALMLNDNQTFGFIQLLEEIALEIEYDCKSPYTYSYTATMYTLPDESVLGICEVTGMAF